MMALDVEGVLADHLSAWLEKKRKEGLNISRDEITWSFTNFPEGTLEDFLSFTDKLWETDWKKFPPLEKDISKKTRKLFKLTNYDIVTFRNKVPYIKMWLSWNGIPFSRVIYTNDKISLGYLIYVDDCPFLAEQIRENQILLLYDRPYNRHVKEAENIYRVRSLDDVIEFVSEL